MQGPTSKAKHRFVGAAATEWSVTGEQTPQGPLSRPCFFCHIDSNMIIQDVANVFCGLAESFAIILGGLRTAGCGRNYGQPPCITKTNIYIYMRNQQKCCCRDSSSEAQFFVLKVAPNHGNRCGELPRAIPCNAMSWKTIGSFTFVCKAWNCSYFFQIVASPHSIPVAIPSRYPSGAWMLTSPSCSWTREKRSRDVPHTWPALSKNPKYDPVIMNTCNFNSIYIYIPWASEPWENVRCSSKPEVWKQNPRFSKFMKFNDLIVCVKYQ